MSKRANILIVEDDIAVQTLVAGYLETQGFGVRVADRGEALLKHLGSESLDLVLLDLNLPDEDGLVLVRQIRARSSIPIIIMTVRADQADRITGLEIGADDYVIKPFHPRELVARVRNVLRRHGEGAAPGGAPLQFDGWVLDPDARTLTAPDGRPVTLTGAEFDVLTALARATGRVMSRHQLLDAAAHGGDPPSERAIDVLISRIRKKVEENPRSPRMIVTVQGHGYKLATVAAVY